MTPAERSDLDTEIRDILVYRSRNSREAAVMIVDLIEERDRALAAAVTR